MMRFVVELQFKFWLSREEEILRGAGTSPLSFVPLSGKVFSLNC